MRFIIIEETEGEKPLEQHLPKGTTNLQALTVFNARWMEMLNEQVAKERRLTIQTIPETESE